ncbi:MAG: hypothetical protein ACE5DS_04540 [Kiloniellaceae bacterium]
MISPYLLRSPRSLAEVIRRREARRNAQSYAWAEAPEERAPNGVEVLGRRVSETAAELRRRGIALRPRVVWSNLAQRKP